MANTTFNGPVRSENGFEVIETNSTTGAKTTYLDANNVTSVSTTASEKGAGVLMRTDASSQAFQLQTYTASISIAAGDTSGNEAAIGMPADFMPMMCAVTVSAASTNAINLVDVGVQADTDDYIDGAALSLGTTTGFKGMLGCNGLRGIAGTDGALSTADEVAAVVSGVPGGTGVTLELTFFGILTATTLNLA